MSSHTIIIRNTLWASIETLLEATIPPLIGVWVARELGPAKLGGFAYVMWLSSLALIVSNLGVASTVAKYLPEAMSQRDKQLARAIVWGAWRFQVCVSVIVVACGLVWAYSRPVDEHIYASLAILSVLPACLMGVATAVNYSFQELVDNSVASLLGVVLQCALTATSLLLEWDLVGLAAALLAGRALDCGHRTWCAKRRLETWLGSGLDANGGGMDAATRSRLLRFSFQATVLMLLNVLVWSRSEMFFLKRMSSLEEVAFYSLAFGLGLLPKQLASPFTKAATAALYVESGRSHERGTRVAELSTRYQALVVFPAAFGLAVLSGPLVRVLYGAKYYSAAPVLFCAAALGPLGHLADPIVVLLCARNEQRRLILWTVCAGAVVLCLDWWLVGWLAALGGALANGFGQAVLVFGLWWLARHACAFKLPGSYLVRLICSSATMACGVALLGLVMSDLTTIILGLPTGIILFVVGMKIWQVLGPVDEQHLAALARVLPARVRPQYISLLSWLVGTARFGVEGAPCG